MNNIISYNLIMTVLLHINKYIVFVTIIKIITKILDSRILNSK